MKSRKKHTQTAALGSDPGAAVDLADRNHVDSALVKEEVKELNNNPRNTDDQMP